MSEGSDSRMRLSSSDSGSAARKTRATGWLQPLTRPDALFGATRLSGWAAALLETAPFQRLAGVSLSDVPGSLLFRRSFPSRLDHAIGVYHLARLARPRDRALQAAALAHDLGHGPFSHLTEPLMIERLGIDHEQRSARLALAVRDGLAPWVQRYLDWLDWDEVAALVQGKGGDGRGALLNGLMDYDNIDNIARFLISSGLGAPGYDPIALARSLTVRPEESSNDGAMGVVMLTSASEAQARAWQHDRRIVYDYLHSGERNLALRAMLRKAIDLAATSKLLPPDFLDYTDDEALAYLEALPAPGAAMLIAGVSGDMEYRRIWAANLVAEQRALLALLSSRDERLSLEARLASEAGFAAHEVIVEPIVSSAERALPPVLGANGQDGVRARPAQPAMRLNIFAAPGAPSDYLRRLHIAASRAFSHYGVSADMEMSQ